MAKVNQFSRPLTPPAPLFIGQNERNFDKQVATEVAERIINQPILYYSIDLEATEYHPLYGEAIQKSFLPPIIVYAFIETGDFSTKVDHFGLEKDTKITIHFLKRRLTEDQNVYVREGDFVLHNQIIYEIVKLSEPQSPYGQAQHRVEIAATCIKSRKGNFSAQ